MYTACRHAAAAEYHAAASLKIMDGTQVDYVIRSVKLCGCIVLLDPTNRNHYRDTQVLWPPSFFSNVGQSMVSVGSP